MGLIGVRIAGRARRALAALSALLIPAVAQAQQASVTGRVTAVGTSEPLVDARVMVVGTSIGGLTNQDGHYTIRGAPAGVIEVRVIRVGYQEQKKAVTTTAGAIATLDFTMTTRRRRPSRHRHHGDWRAAARRAWQRGLHARRRQQARRDVVGHQHERPARRQGAWRQHSAGQHDGQRGADPHPRRQLARRCTNNPIWVVDGVRFNAGAIGVGVGGTRRRAAQRSQPRRDRGHRDREGPVGRDAVRHRRGERRHRHHDQEGTRRQRALDVVRRGRLRAGPQQVSDGVRRVGPQCGGHDHPLPELHDQSERARSTA